MTGDPHDLPDVSPLTIGVLGGTGDQGRGLAYRLAHAGQHILIGSRTPQRAEDAAAAINGLGVATAVQGATNHLVATSADVVIIAVPWEAHESTIADLRDALAGKIVVDCVNPLGFDKRGPYPLPVPEGSATQQAAALLPQSRVVGAFHHVSSVLLVDPQVPDVDQDVLVLADDREAAAVVQALAARIAGMRGIYAGRLRNAGQVEALTANLIAINRRYRTHAGIRVTEL